MDRASKLTTRNAHIAIMTARGKNYAELRVGPSTISLGRFDRSDPTSLLCVCLTGSTRLTVYELFHLLRCDKSQREPNRRPGRQRKYRRI